MPWREQNDVNLIVHGALTNPPLRGILERVLGRTMPIEYDRKVLA